MYVFFSSLSSQQQSINSPHLHSPSVFLDNSFQMSAGAPPASTGTISVDAIKQIAESKDPKKLSGISLYSRFAFAGAVCCSVTHGALTPVDV